MGKGFLRRRKVAKFAEQVKQMQEDTKRLVEDPEGAFQKMAKPLITQLQAATYEKNKLSALVCALIEAAGGTTIVKRGLIDRFQKHRLTILSETSPEDDGNDPEVKITFTYKAEFINQPPIDQPPAPVATPIGNDSADGLVAEAEDGALAAGYAAGAAEDSAIEADFAAIGNDADYQEEAVKISEEFTPEPIIEPQAEENQ